MYKVTCSRVSPLACAGDVLATVPFVMRSIRQEMRRHRQGQLTVPQFRILIFLHHDADPSLSDLAEHVGCSLPAASRMADLLVRRGLIGRQPRRNNRRSVSLFLTGRGRRTYSAALRAARACLARRLEVLSPGDRKLLSQALAILQRAFGPDHSPGPAMMRNLPRARGDGASR